MGVTDKWQISEIMSPTDDDIRVSPLWFKGHQNSLRLFFITETNWHLSRNLVKVRRWKWTQDSGPFVGGLWRRWLCERWHRAAEEQGRDFLYAGTEDELLPGATDPGADFRSKPGTATVHYSKPIFTEISKQETFILCLLCTWHTSRQWGYKKKFLFGGAYILAGETDNMH